MQNKPNLKNTKINATPYTAKAYNQKPPQHQQKNKPNIHLPMRQPNTHLPMRQPDPSDMQYACPEGDIQHTKYELQNTQNKPNFYVRATPCGRPQPLMQQRFTRKTPSGSPKKNKPNQTQYSSACEAAQYSSACEAAQYSSACEAAQFITAKLIAKPDPPRTIHDIQHPKMQHTKYACPVGGPAPRGKSDSQSDKKTVLPPPTSL
jgi:hypothetical protein